MNHLNAMQLEFLATALESNGKTFIYISKSSEGSREAFFLFYQYLRGSYGPTFSMRGLEIRLQSSTKILFLESKDLTQFRGSRGDLFFIDEVQEISTTHNNV